MPEILLTLGQARDLALAETLHLLAWQGDAEFVGWAGHVALLRTESEPDLARLTRTAGGVVKAHRVLGRTPFDPDRIAGFVREAGFLPAPDTIQGKFTFGVSLEGFEDPPPAQTKHFRALAQRIKNALTERGIASRFIGFKPGEKHLALSSVQVGENGLLTEGFELVVARYGDECVLGRTEAVQDYVAYGARDFDRPERLVKSGLLPPKLARMMVNLARTPETATIFDPFCGSGGILTEALDLGLSAVGTDSDPQAVEAAVRNIEWLQSHKGGLPEWGVRLADARTLLQQVEPLTAEAVATETYLGPPLTRPLRGDQAKKLEAELRDLYLESLGEIRSACRPGARVCIALPRIRTQDKKGLAFSLRRELDWMGYREIELLPGRRTLVYSRPGQTVAREIRVLVA